MKVFTSKNLFLTILFFSVATLNFSAFAGEEGHGHGDEQEAFVPGPWIMHHVMDAHEIHVTHGVSIPLPIILWTENGLKTFSSGHFYHSGEGGHGSHIEVNGVEEHYYEYDDYILYHEQIFYNEANGGIEGLVAKKAAGEPVSKPMDWSISKSVFGMLLILGIMCFVFIRIAKKYSKNPKSAPSGVQSFFEPLIIFIRDEVAVPSLGEKKAEKFLPFLLSAFFFILLSNFFGLIPFIGGFNVTGTIAVTLVLATMVFVMTSINGNKHYWGHILWPPGVPFAVKVILVPIEILSVFLKPFILMVRLTANISAGHIVLLSFVSLTVLAYQGLGMGGYWGVGVGAGLFMIFMFFIEILVAFLQAYVFTLLAALYFGDATQEAHH